MSDFLSNGLSTRFSHPAAISPLPAALLHGGHQHASRQNETLTVGFVFRVLQRWWKVVLPLSILLAAAGGAVVWATFLPTYRATAWLMIMEQPKFLAFKPDASTRFVQNQIELLRSPLLLERVLAVPEVAGLPEIVAQVGPVEWLQKNMMVKNLGGSDIFELSFAGNNPEHTTAIVNAIIYAYKALAHDRIASDNEVVIASLNKELVRRAEEVQRLERRVKDLYKQIFGKDPTALMFSRETSPIPSERNTLQGRLISKEVEREVTEAELNAMIDANSAPRREISEDELDQLVDSRPDIVKFRDDLAQLKQRMQETERRLQPGPQGDQFRQRVRDQVNGEERRLEELRDNLKSVMAKELLAADSKRRQETINGLRQKVATLKLEETLLKDKVDKLKEDKQLLSDDTVDLELKKGELARAKDVYDRIAERIVALNTESLAPERIDIWRKAATPNEPESRYPWKPLSLVCLALFLLPCLIVVAWERHVSRILDSEQIATEAALPVIGEIAMLPRRRLTGPPGTKQLSWSRHLFEESIDSLRTSLVLSDELKDLKVIAVVSAVSQEGKTSLAAQLAISLSRACGEKVLLIDADLRSPELHNVFEVSKEPGLVKALSNGTAVRDAIRPTAVNPLVHLLPAGRLHKSPHSLFGRGHLKALIDELRDEYRYIVIDTPPLLSASESLVVAKAADGALICTLRESSRAGQLRLSYQRLQSAGARVIGVVLSGVPTKTYAYRYGSYGYSKPLV